MFSPNFKLAPDSLAPEAEKRWENIRQALNQSRDDWSQLFENLENESINQDKDSVTFSDQLLASLVGSIFVSDYIIACPDTFLHMLENGELWQSRSDDFYQEKFSEIVKACENIDQLMVVLREFRASEMCRIIWRELNGFASLQQTTGELSRFAAACIQSSLQKLHQFLAKDFGDPMSGKGLSEQDSEVQMLNVIAMGKLGGGELNLSSDIDLIFFYRDAGKTNGKRSIDNQQFFTRLAQSLIRVLDERTAQGFVFRVDMRLRPYGESGMLVLNQNAMELYYETQGRAWERYAFVKASLIAGDLGADENFLDVLKPFVYRRYVDFSVVDSLREMKKLINRQVETSQTQNDIKLGEGGIRELEFIAQAFQLIQGGRIPEIQQRSYFAAMTALVEAKLILKSDAEALLECYTFLRNIEHLLQAYDDQQTQQLPHDEQLQLLLAWQSGFTSWQQLLERIDGVRQIVRASFNELLSPISEEVTDKDKSDQSRLGDYLSFWQGGSQLSEGFDAYVSDSLKAFSQEKQVKNLPEIERQRLDKLIPILLLKLEAFDEQGSLLDRFLKFTRVVLRRSAYLVLLLENDRAFTRLLDLFNHSEWVLDKIIQHPFLLDELLHLDAETCVESKEALAAELNQQLLRCHPEDLELQMETFRIFKGAHEMRTAALFLTESISVTNVGDHLSHLADVILTESCYLALHMALKSLGIDYEVNDETVNKEELIQNFALLAYGKLGSEEMGFGSDLDLVFLYDSESPASKKYPQLYTRMGQKLIHLLSVRTYSGILYEVDMRLRPSGKSGPLASSMIAFKRYQEGQAWTWEHQALVKARVLVASQDMAKRVLHIRNEALLKSRASEQLLKDIQDMQQRLAENFQREKRSLGVLAKDDFHLKSSDGGLIDIEFIAQYIVLSMAGEHAELLECRATLEIFRVSSDHGLVSSEILADLSEAYIQFRSMINGFTLQRKPAVLKRVEIEKHYQNIKQAWVALEKIGSGS